MTTVMGRKSYVFIVAMLLFAGTAFGQVVRIAPIVKQTATPGGSERFSGANPPASDALIATSSTFYLELWATNSGAPQDGLACVYVDLTYSRTDLMNPSPPIQNSPLFTVNAVTPTLDDANGLANDLGGCQPIPATDFLGVGEWVLVKRLPMVGTAIGGPASVTLADADNAFAGTSIIGQLNNVDPADIEFLSNNFNIGECLTAGDCNDGVGCTDDTCVSFVCVHTPNNALCDDGQFCNGAETCHLTLDCQAGTSPTCNDGVACTDDSCNPAGAGGAGACVNAVNNANCDDGQFCNGAETCDAVLNCQAGTPPNCTVVGSDGVGCTDESCSPAANGGAGGCISTPNNANCDNGQFCDGAETCDPVLDCQAGTAPTCNDGVACTDDVCDPAANAGACVNNANNANCDDGQFCNGAETCDPVLDCQAGTPPNCAVLQNDGVACTDDVCDPAANAGAGGCVNIANDANCDDVQFCNGAETCNALLGCQAGTPPNCAVLDNDGVACTDDVCDPAASGGAGACVNNVNNANCSDGQFCNGAETCDALLGCQAGTPPDCAIVGNDGVACTDDVCDPAANAGAGACVNNPNNANCDNGQFCDGAETCDVLLGCQAGTPPNCAVLQNDGVACTDDVCDPLANAGAGACANNVNNANCNDSVACTDDTCDAVLGCQFTPNNANCNDGVGCTDDTCNATLDCQFTPNHANCNDSVACTDDTCNAVLDCQFTPNNAHCDDGQFCNGAETCDPVLNCQAGTPPNCAVLDNDGVACTDDVCDPAANAGAGACVNNANNANCDDGQFCNGAETCDPVLNCQAGTPPNCAVLQNDGVACTDDVCDPLANAGAGACVNNPNNANCNDSVACTVDTCDPVLNCQFTPNNGNCNDGVACTDDTCDLINDCQFTPNDTNCDDLVGCTDDTCDSINDCQFTPNNANCDDSQFCNGAETCNALLDCQTGTAPTCNDGVGCTDDSCNPAANGGTGACANAANDANCNDGLFCTGVETCNALLGCQAGSDPCAGSNPNLVCNDVQDRCDNVCLFDCNFNTATDSADYGYFLGCFGKLISPVSYCACADYNRNGAGDTGDYSGLLGCFGDYCPCPSGPLPAAPYTDIQLSLVVSPEARSPDYAKTLPVSMRTVEAGQTFYVHVWASLGEDVPVDSLACAVVDLEYDDVLVEVGAAQSAKSYSLFDRAFVAPGEAVVRSVGGCITPQVYERYQGVAWARIATIVMKPVDAGLGTLRLVPTSDPFSGVSIAGQNFNLNAAEISFAEVSLRVREPSSISGRGRSR